MRPMYFSMFSNRMIMLAATSVVLVTFVSLFVYQVHAQPLLEALSANSVVSVSPGTVNLSAAAALPVAKSQSLLEVNIANDGAIFLRGARVVSISGDMIHVAMAFGASNFKWALQTSSNTKFPIANGSNQTINDIHVGDTVAVTGIVILGGSEPTVEARFIRE